MDPGRCYESLHSTGFFIPIGRRPNWRAPKTRLARRATGERRLILGSATPSISHHRSDIKEQFVMETTWRPPTGHRPARPRIHISAYCNGCGTQIHRGFTHCPPCQKAQRIHEARQAINAVYAEARACSRCAATLNVDGPARQQLCCECREVWSS